MRVSGGGRPDPPALRPGRCRASLRTADALLARLLEIAAERLLLLRAFFSGVRAAARGGVGSEAAEARVVGDSSGGCGVRSRWLHRVLQPRALLERPGDQVERIPHLLPGPLDLLGPQHLWALPRAGDRRGDVGAAVGEGTANAGIADGAHSCPLARPRRHLLPIQLRRTARGPGCPGG